MTKRVHLFELQDLPWYPAALGEAGTAYLRAVERAAGAAALLRPHVAAALDKAGETRIIDLCSGAGGPVVDVAALLRAEGRPVELTLSDLRPNRGALDALAASGVRVHPRPVDAAAVPPELRGLRTIFNGFHHFDDALALAVLRDAVRAGAPVAIFELGERSAPMILSAALIPLLVLLMMPFVRPARLSWLILTYLVPVLPWTIAWDGLVSHLRVRDPGELLALTQQLDAPGWTWEAERIPAGRGVGITWLLGVPPAA